VGIEGTDEEGENVLRFKFSGRERVDARRGDKKKRDAAKLYWTKRSRTSCSEEGRGITDSKKQRLVKNRLITSPICPRRGFRKERRIKSLRLGHLVFTDIVDK